MTGSLKYNRRTVLKPGHHTACATTPGTFPFQFTNQAGVELSPQSFRRNTSIVPVECDGTAELARIVNNVANPPISFLERKIKIVRIEQCCIHHMQGKFEQVACLQWFIDFSSPGSIPDRLVIPNG